MDISREIALKLAYSAKFSHFSRFDHDAFAGVRSALPMIADTIYEGKELLLVLDGNFLEVSDNDGNFEVFDLFE